MAESELPARSLDGLSALPVFYDDFNDVHFYVEDEDQENLYEIVLGRMFPDFKIARVFPLGGKQAVLEHSSQMATRPAAPPSVYLVDKDFDDFLGVAVRRPMLFYLERYCIENYLSEPSAIVEVIVESLPKLKRAEIAAALNLAAKIPEFMESIRPLFQLFYCVQHFDLGIKNCALSIERFCSEKHRWIVDVDALADYRSKVIDAASQTRHAVELTDPLKHPAIERLSTLDAHTVVSGKHTCMLVFHYLKSKYNIGSITFDSFLFRLAKNSSLHALQDLAARIRASLRCPAAVAP